MDSISAAAADQKRKRRFVPLPAKSQEPKVPRVSALSIAGASTPAPRAVLDRLGGPSVIVGFDCETHDWREVAARKGRVGPFGWYTMNDDVDFARIVQLAWAVGDANVDAEVVVKCALVRPEGYEISSKASAHHHITQQDVLQKGRPLADVLQEFMHDVAQTQDSKA